MSDTIEDYTPIIKILSDIFGKYGMHNEYKFQITYCCPICSYEIKELDHLDGKYNLEINYELRVYNCWSCGDTHGTHGSLRSLIRKHGQAKHLKQYDLFIPEDIPEKIKIKKPDVIIPKEFIPFVSASDGLKMTHYYKQAKNYLNSRNISDELIIKFNIGFCYQGEYKNRIIIPSYDEKGRLNYFVGRSYESNPRFKYKNPESEKEMIIWNEYLINWDKPIYIVEGPFDCLFLPNSIPLLGKKMSDKLFELLYEKAKEVIVLLDGDAYDNAVKLYHKLNGGRLWGKVRIIKLPIDKDIADLVGDITEYKEIQLD